MMHYLWANWKTQADVLFILSDHQLLTFKLHFTCKTQNGVLLLPFDSDTLIAYWKKQSLIQFVVKHINLSFSIRGGVMDSILSEIQQHLFDAIGISDQHTW